LLVFSGAGGRIAGVRKGGLGDVPLAMPNENAIRGRASAHGKLMLIIQLVICEQIVCNPTSGLLGTAPGAQAAVNAASDARRTRQNRGAQHGMN
jgi:hypothetical protein